MKLMALDLGDVRTGVAFSDTGLIASRAHTITERNRQALLEQVCRLAEEESPARIVVGLPINMNGTEGERAASARAFAASLEAACGCQVVLWDERGSSVTANRILSDAGKKRAKQRAKVDAVAATVILQSYLDSLNLTL